MSGAIVPTAHAPTAPPTAKRTSPTPTAEALHSAMLVLADAYDPRTPGSEVHLDLVLIYFYGPRATDVYAAADDAIDRAFLASRARDRERWLLRRYEAAVRLAHRGECPD